MQLDMLMPQMGESITEATIVKWRKAVGDSVKKDEIILEISTDKVDSEIPSPGAGIITEVLFNEGDVVPVKAKIATISSDGQGANPQPSAATPEAPLDQTQTLTTPEKVETQIDKSSGKFFSPLVKSLAEKHGVLLAELEKVEGSGQGGRVTKEDFIKYVDNKSAAPQKAAPAAAAPTPPTPIPTPPTAAGAAAKTSSGTPSDEWGADGTRVVMMDSMRQAIADHMVRSKHTSPHVYSIQEVDVTAIATWRTKYKSAFEKQEGFGLSFTPFFLEATVKALQQFPHVNASVDGKKIILKKNVNLGCAVALGNSGLVVPVIRKAEEKNLVGLARGLNDIALRARSKKLVPDDVSGGTFTVTNVGTFGTIIGTPIINQPQAAILCLGAIKKRPVVIDDMIAIRQICYLTLSYDHRIIDGSLGGQFLAFVREYLEGWDAQRPLY